MGWGEMGVDENKRETKPKICQNDTTEIHLDTKPQKVIKTF